MKVYTGSPNSQLSVQDQKEIFQIRSITSPLPSNREDPKLFSTGCGSMMENLHIYLCPVLNREHKGDLNKIINGTLREIKKNTFTVARKYEED